MKGTVKMIVWTFQVLFLIFVMWFIGLIFQLPLIPIIETGYFLTGTNQKLSDRIEIKQKNGVKIQIEIPNEFDEENQCFDIWFVSTKGNHNLSVNKISTKAFDDKKNVIRPSNSYLFWDDGSKDETFEIKNYQISQSDTLDNQKYVFFRSVFNIDNQDKFSINLKTNFTVDNIIDSLDNNLAIEKTKRLTWNKFRVH